MSEKAYRYLVLAAFAALLLGPRLGHLRGPIDDPHSWRQCDTANYAWAFYKDGSDLFRPSERLAILLRSCNAKALDLSLRPWKLFLSPLIGRAL